MMMMKLLLLMMMMVLVVVVVMVVAATPVYGMNNRDGPTLSLSLLTQCPANFSGRAQGGVTFCSGHGHCEPSSRACVCDADYAGYMCEVEYPLALKQRICNLKLFCFNCEHWQCPSAADARRLSSFATFVQRDLRACASEFELDADELKRNLSRHAFSELVPADGLVTVNDGQCATSDVLCFPQYHECDCVERHGFAACILIELLSDTGKGTFRLVLVILFTLFALAAVWEMSCTRLTRWTHRRAHPPHSHVPETFASPAEWYDVHIARAWEALVHRLLFEICFVGVFSFLLFVVHGLLAGLQDNTSELAEFLHVFIFFLAVTFVAMSIMSLVCALLRLRVYARVEAVLVEIAADPDSRYYGRGERMLAFRSKSTVWSTLLHFLLPNTLVALASHERIKSVLLDAMNKNDDDVEPSTCGLSWCSPSGLVDAAVRYHGGGYTNLRSGMLQRVAHAGGAEAVQEFDFVRHLEYVTYSHLVARLYLDYKLWMVVIVDFASLYSYRNTSDTSISVGSAKAIVNGILVLCSAWALRRAHVLIVRAVHQEHDGGDAHALPLSVHPESPLLHAGDASSNSRPVDVGTFFWLHDLSRKVLGMSGAQLNSLVEQFVLALQAGQVVLEILVYRPEQVALGNSPTEGALLRLLMPAFVATVLHSASFVVLSMATCLDSPLPPLSRKS